MTKARTNNNTYNKKLAKEKKRQEYKPKPKQPKMEYPEPEVHEIAGIKYIMLGNTPYAVDEKGVISYADTAVLRKILDSQTDS